ncbi:hypothetical protein CHH83_02100 [Bacillus sp. 7586-K]|nr:hypothetical protein CHH83_02100 [Bacillus sp. 7586-K]
MESHEKIVIAIDNGISALKEISNGNKRKGLFYLDHVKDEIQGAIFLLLAEIEEDEKESKL